MSDKLFNEILDSFGLFVIVFTWFEMAFIRFKSRLTDLIWLSFRFWWRNIDSAKLMTDYLECKYWGKIIINDLKSKYTLK